MVSGIEGNSPKQVRFITGIPNESRKDSATSLTLSSRVNKTQKLDNEKEINLENRSL
jgi:hypothetical protein